MTGQPATDTVPSPAAAAPESVDVKDARRPSRVWTGVLTCVVGIVCVQGALSLSGNRNLGWPSVGHYLFSPAVLHGVAMTLYLTVLAMAIGVVLGGVLSAFRMSTSVVLRAIASLFIWFFRGTPLLVQLIFWFNIALLIPKFSIGIPYGPVFASVDANKVVTPMLAATVGLGLHEAPYQAEIYRAGLMSVDEGQVEAAKSLGFRPLRIFLTVRLPQAMRFIVPPTFSQIIGMTKGTAMVSVIGGGELLFSVQEIYSQTFETIPLLLVACVWYLLITTALNIVQHFVERHYGKGASRNQRKGIVQVLRGNSAPARGRYSEPEEAHGR
ncbi:amino acid ABC transporter permease [Streptomyces puniciscabiei]